MGTTQLKRLVARVETLAAVQEAVWREGPVAFDRLAIALGTAGGALEGAVLWLGKFDLIRIRT